MTDNIHSINIKSPPGLAPLSLPGTRQQNQYGMRLSASREAAEHQSKVHFAEIWLPNTFLNQREGQVLGRDMLLKSDYFADSTQYIKSNKDFNISGGPNFRQVILKKHCYFILNFFMFYFYCK